MTDDDLVLHGELAEFKANSRCKACQDRDNPCFIQAEGDRCIACVGAACECVFTRIIAVTALKTNFSWNQLINKKNTSGPTTHEAALNAQYVRH